MVSTEVQSCCAVSPVDRFCRIWAR